ncbi:MAG: ATPase, partial [Sphaerochaeta sp.]
PMDFEEFLWALENETLMDYIRKCFSEKKPMGQVLHRKAMDYFRQYLIVGGMPQAVEEYIRTRDFDRVDRIKRDILTLYRADIIKHAKGYEMKTEQIFDDIPAQLQKHDRKFRVSSLKKEARLRDYKDALFWLDDAMIVNICYNSSAPTIGLRLNMDRMTLKCYMADTGLLISHAFDENGIVSEELYKKILFDKGS